MQYFFLEKQSPLTQRWKVRQIAFDPKYRYLYYSGPVSQSELEAAAHAAAVAELSGKEEEDVPVVAWRKKIKVTALEYMADEYAVPPTSADFQEKMLLTMMVRGYERKLEKPAKTPKKRRSNLFNFAGGGSTGDCRLVASEDPTRSAARLNTGRYNGFGNQSTNSTTHTSPNPTSGLSASERSPNALRTASNATLRVDNDDPPPPEPPSPVLHVEGYDVGAVAQTDDVEDAEENLFRDIELVPDSNPDDLDADEDEEDAEEDEEDEDDVVLKSPATMALSEIASEDHTSYYSFASSRTGPKTITVTFRARNYDAFRVVSLRLRQALVRHGLYQPLHAGLPPYDPRNGIAFATVPLHLRYQFRRLNDVVFYSFQHGHAVYVRHLREVRGLSGYLCITHESVLLLQADGKCPRWVDLEDITGIDYVLNGSRSFVSILAASPMPDFLFIPIFPVYPLVSNFDAESAVEGMVDMLRRLLMQRLRADEDVSLAPLPKHEDLDADNASDVEDYEALCHIRDLTPKFDDVFQYISQNGPGRPLQWKWENSKTPKHFTYKKNLAEALKRDEESDDDEESDEEDDGAPHREGVLPAHPIDRTRRETGDRAFNASMLSAASFTTATVAQLLAAPSEAAELRARERLRVTRTDPEKREMKRAQSPGVRPAPVTVAAVAAMAAGGAPKLPPEAMPPVPSAKPESYGLVHAPQPEGIPFMNPGVPHLVPAAKGARLPANAPAVLGAVANSGGGVGAAAVPVKGNGKATSVAVPHFSTPHTTMVPQSGKSAFGITNTKKLAPAKPPKGGNAVHVDPSKSGSPGKGASSPRQTEDLGVDEEDEEGDEDDDVFDSEDVDDLLEEPLAGALHTTPRRRHQSKLLRKRRGERRPGESHSAQISEEDSDYEDNRPPRPQSRRPAAAAAVAATALPTPGISPDLPPNAPPAQPPTMPTPTLQANTKLATDFLVTCPGPSNSPEEQAALPPPVTLPPPPVQ